MNQNSSKERLILAAIKIFSIHGYAGASTRMIAKEANINISSIAYYFSGKHGLYEASFEYIADKIKSEISKQGLNDRNLKNLETNEFIDIFSRMINFMLSDNISPYMANIILKEIMFPSTVFNTLYERFLKNAHETLTFFVSKFIAEPPSSELSILCAHTILSQVIGFKTHKEILLRRIGWGNYYDEEIKKISEVICNNTLAILSSYKQRKNT